MGATKTRLMIALTSLDTSIFRNISSSKIRKNPNTGASKAVKAIDLIAILSEPFIVFFSPFGIVLGFSEINGQNSIITDKSVHDHLIRMELPCPDGVLSDVWQLIFNCSYYTKSSPEVQYVYLKSSTTLESAATWDEMHERPYSVLVKRLAGLRTYNQQYSLTHHAFRNSCL